MKLVGSIGGGLALLATSATVGVLSCRPLTAEQPAEVAQPAASPANVVARHDYAAVAQMLDRFIAHEMADKDLSALSIALVDDQQTVWAQGFGWANPGNKTPATAQTVYRVGSVSKLFTDIAIMQLVEQGKLDLDAPVTRYLPDFQPHNSYGKSITLRQLMSHRSGLTREPPAGHYFDPTEPSLAQTIASLNRTELVYAPESRVKYSNAAVAVAGYLLERTQNQPFAKYLGHAVLEPLDMRHSSFQPTPAVVGKLAHAYMWTLDGRVFEAPTFQLGISPAGSLYTTVMDLGRFMSALFAGGRGTKGPVLRPATLEQMWTPQFSAPAEKSQYGIGFGLSELEGHREVGHSGAIYGFATTLRAVPDEKIGVVVVTARDGANAVTRRVAEAALRAMLAVHRGQAILPPELSSPVSPDVARRAAGRYIKGEHEVELMESGGQLSLLKLDGGGQPLRLRMLGDALITDGRLGHGDKVVLRENAIVLGDDEFTRLASHKARTGAGKVARAHRRIWLGSRHPLCVREGRQVMDADRVVRSRPARAGVGKRVQIPGSRSLRWRAADLHAGRERRGDAGDGRPRRLQTPPYRARRRRRATTDQAVAPGG